MINLNKNMEAILQSQRDQKIAKEGHHRRNKTIITKFGIRSSRISLIYNTLMIYWVENQHKLYRQFLSNEHTPPTPECKSALESIWFLWTVEKVSANKGHIRKRNKIIDDPKKGICAFLSYTIVGEAIPLLQRFFE